jgi:L-glyceraldehyde 3-phosphate reductase
MKNGSEEDILMYIADEKRYDTMPYNRCGKSGLLLPAVSLGLWHNFGSNGNFDNMEAVCHTAFDHGITHFDLANNYGPVPGAAEENFGRILRKGLGVYRDELVISTKAGYDMWPGPYGNWGSKKYLVASLDQSLRRMGLEYVDIFYHHRPDPETPLEETARALDGIVRSGKALYVGISNYNKEQTVEIASLFAQMGTPFIINQRKYSMFVRTIEEDGLKDYAAAHGIGVITFSPLAQGLLTDRYLHGIPEDSRIRTDGRFLKESAVTADVLGKIGSLNELAAQRGQSLAQMALAWILRDGDITSVLIGASRPSQVLDNIGMIGNTSFSEEERRRIDEILES